MEQNIFIIFRDLFLKIFLYSDLDTLKILSLTCKKFNEIINSNLFCKQRLLLKFPKVNIDNVDFTNMKKLYRYLISRCKVATISGYIHTYDSRSPAKISRVITSHLVKKYNLKNGDIVIFTEDSDVRFLLSDNSFIKYWGIIHWEFSLPACLNFPQFPPYYWTNYIRPDNQEIEMPLENSNTQCGYLIGRFNEKYKILYSDEPYNCVKFFVNYEAELF